jgi:secreted PhoX family phosphatase
MMLSRRQWLKNATAATLGFTGLAAFAQRGGAKPLPLALESDPAGILDLPKGFSYKIISRTGDPMTDGFFTPGSPDGMATFAIPGDPDRVRLVRNHELNPTVTDRGAFGPDHGLAKRLAPELIYDRAPDGRPLLGGTSSFTYNLKTGQIEQSNLSLAGTTQNCAGGATPWGSWLTCEERADQAGNLTGKDHGFVFEVPASATSPVQPVPIKAMGRFMHEAAAVHPPTGIVYLTQDEPRCLFYRYLPNAKGELAKGGRLQALAIRGHKTADLRNWPVDSEPGWGAGTVKPGVRMPVEWIDLDQVEAPDGDLNVRGAAKGAALFSRGEGIIFGLSAEGRPEIYFTTTDAGAAQTGQVWRYTPSIQEGGSGEKAAPGYLELFYESPGSEAMESGDNVTIAPWGGLMLCEDRPVEKKIRNHMQILTRQGDLIPFATNMHKDNGEFTGICFSPDAGTLFVNIQRPGFTLAINGPWETIARHVTAG